MTSLGGEAGTETSTPGQLFDPLMANSPAKQNRRSPTGLQAIQTTRMTCLATRYLSVNISTGPIMSRKSAISDRKLIDFGDASVDGDDELALPGSSAVVTEPQLDNGDGLLSTPLLDSHEEMTRRTPLNRRILGDIDVDVLQPPKPPTKQGALKISFLTAVNGGTSPADGSTTDVTSSDPKPDPATSGPVITLYPPTFNSIPLTSSAPQISDKVDDYLSPHRVSVDLQLSFQLQLQNGDYSFNLVSDEVFFLESGGASVPEPDNNPDVDNMFKPLDFVGQGSGCEILNHPPNPRHREVLTLSHFIISRSDAPGAKPTTTLNMAKKPTGSLRRPSLASRPPILVLQSVATASKPPMRVLIHSSKRPSPITTTTTTTTTQRTTVVRPPSCRSSTTGSLPKSVVAMTKTIGESTDGPRRVLVETQGPQRVLVRTAPGTMKSVKKPLGPSSSINPPAPTCDSPVLVALPFLAP
ncbi:hypothetical protein BDM02DRAFT_3201119 [Thelephora ganbajun]|uniref:Uncharacterized protein n=1 Tax=Thelephora ganbajun TaxID=370292 RepID=A0ACB6Z973_THEGA|nr:hypothetical protein BDM02DRAFT_3201119 [Thelephora ganbajun]